MSSFVTPVLDGTSLDQLKATQNSQRYGAVYVTFTGTIDWHIRIVIPAEGIDVVLTNSNHGDSKVYVPNGTQNKQGGSTAATGQSDIVITVRHAGGSGGSETEEYASSYTETNHSHNGARHTSEWLIEEGTSTAGIVVVMDDNAI